MMVSIAILPALGCAAMMAACAWMMLRHRKPSASADEREHVKQ